MSKTPNNIIRDLMVRLSMSAILTSGDEEVDRPCESSVAIGVYPGKRRRRRDICIRTKHPHHATNDLSRYVRRTELRKIERTARRLFGSTTTTTTTTTTTCAARRTHVASRSEAKKRKEKRSEARGLRHSRNARSAR